MQSKIISDLSPSPSHAFNIVLQRIFGDLRIRATTRYFVTAGGTVRLQCPVQPRGLYNYYYGYWERNGTRIIEVPRPSNDGQVANIMRHSSEIVELDRQTFTLTIRSVNRSQASDSYRCVLHNLNPDNGNAQQFTQAASLSISLMVDGKVLMFTIQECMLQTLKR